MEFNRKQLTIICLGVIVIAAMCIYPPWIHIETFYIANGADLGSSYGFIFQKPHPERGLFPKSSIDISRLSVQIFIVLVFVVGGVIILKRLDTPEKPIGPHPDVVPSLGTIEDQMRFFVPKELRRNRQARVLFGVLHRGKIDRWIYQEAFREKILDLIRKSGLARSLELIEDFLHPFPEVMRGESLEETVDGLLSIDRVSSVEMEMWLYLEKQDPKVLEGWEEGNDGPKLSQAQMKEEYKETNLGMFLDLLP